MLIGFMASSVVPWPGGMAALVAGLGTAGPSRQSGASAVQEGARQAGRPGRGKMFPAGPKRQDSAGAAGTNSRRPAPGKDLWSAWGERSERPVAGTDEAAQADKPG
jgi:hypothetical protein